MSSCSSDNGVIRTRIPGYEDDNTILYAFEPNNANANKQENGVSDKSYNEEQQKSIQDILTHCQVICDAIQKLDKKFDVIHGKVSKIHRFHAKILWQNRKPLGYTHRNYSYLLTKKLKYQKMRKKGPPAVFNYPESYSPTLPVERQESNSQPNCEGAPFQSEAPTEVEQPVYEEQDRGLIRSPPAPSVFSTRSYQSYYTPEDAVPGPSVMPCFSSPKVPSTSSIFSPSRPAVAIPASMLAQGEPSTRRNPEVMGYPGILENKNVGQRSLCIPSGFVTSSPIGSDFSGRKQNYFRDPSGWSVDDVIQFVRQIDPQTSMAIIEVFRQHDIDGKALLLLKSDTMMKYMGLKLGTAVKLSHYIERLKQDNYLSS
ncbi:sex comb on midleg-like protein 1 [Loxodonta africana]|uniref:sex comb on midleg-like protein 1 n=1 Tax=Loxodonta africana TaxID=9785 RepID=UPI000C81213B|nr:sex comb on midleg-like protein 1 [Loxodonta africana]